MAQDSVSYKSGKKKVKVIHVANLAREEVEREVQGKEPDVQFAFSVGKKTQTPPDPIMIPLRTKKTSPPLEVRRNHTQPDRIHKTPTKDVNFTADKKSGLQGDAKGNWRAGEGLRPGILKSEGGPPDEDEDDEDDPAKNKKSQDRKPNW